jgi:hypothetical protein
MLAHKILSGVRACMESLAEWSAVNCVGFPRIDDLAALSEGIWTAHTNAPGSKGSQQAGTTAILTHIHPSFDTYTSMQRH